MEIHIIRECLHVTEACNGYFITSYETNQDNLHCVVYTSSFYTIKWYYHWIGRSLSQGGLTLAIYLKVQVKWYLV